MRPDRRRFRGVATACAVIALASVGLVAQPTAAGAGGNVRGFDGTTIKVAGIGNKAQLPNAETGALARIKRFNDDNELKGVKIEYLEMADDKADPTTALTEMRRLVSQVQVFAIVGDISMYNPYDFMKQNKVPFFGWGYEPAYCTPKASTDWWGFAFGGCSVNPEPTVAVDYAGKIYSYASSKLGNEHPTIAVLANDTETGKNSNRLYQTASKGVGFDVVYSKATVPPPPVGDFSPYVQELLTADNGKAPDVVRCAMGAECLNIYVLLTSQGFDGIFWHSLYTDVLVKPLGGSLVDASTNNIDETGVAALDQMRADIEAVKPGQKVESGGMAGYRSTDMFIQALKKAAKNGKSGITPENVRRAASKMTWQMKDFAGPTVYPASTNHPSPYCTSLSESDGTRWVTREPYSCSKKTFPMRG
jgi:ABC-type branched-subunit amino acid transport system substrate-binding protein